MNLVRYVLNRYRKASIRMKIIVVFLLIIGLFVHQMSFSTYHYLVRLQGQDKVAEYRTMANQMIRSNTEGFVLRFDNLVKEMTPWVNHIVLDRLFLETGKWEENVRPDIFFYVDTSGKVVYSGNRADGKVESSEPYLSLDAVQKAMQGHSSGGLGVISGELIRLEGLTHLVHISLENSAKYDLHDKALAFIAAKPVFNGAEKIGVLVAARILNNKSYPVDWLKDKFNVGVSIYLDDVVVTTNEVYAGKRAVGEIIPPNVRNQVLEVGTNYKGRDFINNGWYITSFDPLRDLNNQIIGALYVGIEEAPLLARQEALFNEIRFTLLLLAAVFIAASLWLYKSLVEPVRQLSESALRFALGDFELLSPHVPNTCWEIKNCRFRDCPIYGEPHLRCWLSPKNGRPGNLSYCQGEESCEKCEVFRRTSGNEIDQLTDAFNFMAASINEQTESLYNLTAELEARTGELIDQRDELECQTEQLTTLNNQLQESMQALDDSQSIIYALAVAVETKDQYTRGHSERVAEFSVKLAMQLGTDEKDLAILRGAAILHDIGKIGVSGAILRHPGPLTDSEFEQIRTHPAIGERICLSLKFAREMLPIIRHHHEHVDGKGYPDGLAGDEIPLFARVVAIADAFDAMTSDRPYRLGMPHKKALESLEAGAGSQWDAALVKAFAAIIQKESATQLARLIGEA